MPAACSRSKKRICRSRSICATLDTLGSTDFDGGLHDRFTAHPKTDPHTGELLFFGYGSPESLSSGMSFGIMSRDGRVTRYERFEAPYASMVHDFAVSSGHVLFPVMPLTASRARAEAGRPPFAWEPHYGTRVGIMPRGGSTADLVWWSGPACYVFHVMNAWDFDGSVFVDVMQFDTPPLFPLPDGSPISEAPATGAAGALAVRPGRPAARVHARPCWRRFRASSRASTSAAPACRTATAGSRATRWALTASRACTRAWCISTTPTPQRDIYTFDAPDHVSEPVFVPRAAGRRRGRRLAARHRVARRHELQRPGDLRRPPRRGRPGLRRLVAAPRARRLPRQLVCGRPGCVRRCYECLPPLLGEGRGGGQRRQTPTGPQPFSMASDASRLRPRCPCCSGAAPGPPARRRPPNG